VKKVSNFIKENWQIISGLAAIIGATITYFYPAAEKTPTSRQHPRLFKAEMALPLAIILPSTDLLP
jgi:hypothetical protein